MTEDSFHLTPLDIRTMEFRRGMRGYDPASVDQFREGAAAEVERLLRQNAVAEEQVKNLREQLKAFQEREKALSEALVAAQQLRDDMERSVGHEKAAIIHDAQSEAAEMLGEARRAEQAVDREIEASHRQLMAYLKSFRVLLERNMAEVEALERREQEGQLPVEQPRTSGMKDTPVFKGR